MINYEFQTLNLEQDSEEKTQEQILLEVEAMINSFKEESEVLSLNTVPSSFEGNDCVTQSDFIPSLEHQSTDDFENESEDNDDGDDFEYPPVESIEPVPFWASEDVGSGPSSNSRKNILSIDIPRQMLGNIPTNHRYLDRLMTGSGVTPSTACLVTGIPGSGKSTFMIQVADLITAGGNVAIYNSNEESDVQLSRVAHRLRLKNGFEITSYESVFDIVEHVLNVQEQLYNEYVETFNTMKANGASSKKLFNLRPKQVFLFLDSLQTLEMPHFEYDPKTGRVLKDKNGEPVKKIGRPAQGDNMHLNIVQYLASAWCKRTFGILFLIGQVTKNGEFAGKQGIKHWVDAHLHLDIDRDRKSDTYDQRVAEMTKNRFGPAGLYYAFEIEARGIKFKTPIDE